MTRIRPGLCGLAMLVVLAILANTAGAAGFDVYRRGLDSASGHLRMAWSYARTGNDDLAAIETAEFAAAWQSVADDVMAMPRRSESVQVLAAMVDRVGDLAAQALAHIEAARLAEGQRNLAAARTEMRRAHQRLGISTFADCIWDANRAGDPLWHHARHRPDLAQPKTAKSVQAQIAAYTGALEACDREAPPDLAGTAEFRRLMDGALASLEAAGRAVEAADGDLLHRYLIELVALDRLLFFRFG